MFGEFYGWHGVDDVQEGSVLWFDAFDLAKFDDVSIPVLFRWPSLDLVAGTEHVRLERVDHPLGG